MRSRNWATRLLSIYFKERVDLGTLAVLIIILVFIVMAAQFESLTYPFIIMFSIPFAFSGVLMALYGTGTTLNVMSLLGGIMLIGIVVKWISCLLFG